MEEKRKQRKSRGIKKSGRCNDRFLAHPDENPLGTNEKKKNDEDNDDDKRRSSFLVWREGDHPVRKSIQPPSVSRKENNK